MLRNSQDYADLYRPRIKQLGCELGELPRGEWLLFHRPSGHAREFDWHLLEREEYARLEAICVELANA